MDLIEFCIWRLDSNWAAQYCLINSFIFEIFVLFLPPVIVKFLTFREYVSR